MELNLDDPENPVTKEQIENFIEHVNNQPEFTIDYSGSQILYKSIVDELQLKNHDTFRLITFQSQCTTAIHYLECIIIDYDQKLNTSEVKEIRKIIKKLELLLLDIQKRIELFKSKDHNMEPHYYKKITEITGLYDSARESNDLAELKQLEQKIRNFITLFRDTVPDAQIVRNEAFETKKYISNKIDKLNEKLKDDGLKMSNPKALLHEIKNKEIIDPEITLPDRILRELNIIEALFHAQHHICDNSVMFPYILDSDGNSGINGRYINWFDIISNVELLNLHLYKKVFTDRYENTNNHALLHSQLTEIRGKAIIVRDYYNEYLTDQNLIVKEYFEKKALSSFEESADLTEAHSAVITVNNYQIGEIYLGCSKSNFKRAKNIPDYSFSYMGENMLFARFCQNLIDFIDRFIPLQLSISGLQTKFSLNQLSVIFDQLINSRYIAESSSRNFVAVFQEQPLPVGWDKVKWNGSRKECFSFMMDMCGDDIKAQEINNYFLQYRKSNKTGEINTKLLTSHDRSGLKRGFLDSIKSKS